MSGADWDDLRQCAAHVRNGWRGADVCATAAEVLADLGPVLDVFAELRKQDSSVWVDAAARLDAAWTAAKAKLTGEM